MAAITTTSVGSSFSKIGETIDDAETDKYWLLVPHWAKYAQIWLTMDTKGGTSIQLDLKAAPAWAGTDDHIIQLREAAAFAAVTSADVTSVVDIGPGVTGIADDVTGAAAADSYASINTVLPPVLGVWIVGSGAGNVYNLSVYFRS